MAPQLMADIIILELEYRDDLNPKHPIIQKPDTKSLDGVDDHVMRWCRGVMRDEVKKHPYILNMERDPCLWRIETGDLDHFYIWGQQFDKVIVIIGEETMYFMHLYRPMGIWWTGSCPLVDSICSCCMGYHYLKVMETVKNDVIRASIYYV